MSVVKSKRKSIKSLAQSKIVNIADYRDLQKGQEAQSIAVLTKDEKLFSSLKEILSDNLNVCQLDSRFALEQSLKSNQEWDAILIDERDLKDEALNLCEKLKRQNKMDETILFILSDDSSKDRVRSGLEKGCDEWVTRLSDMSGVARLLDHYLSFGF